jgi:hypothetical protein
MWKASMLRLRRSYASLVSLNSRSLVIELEFCFAFLVVYYENLLLSDYVNVGILM